jgi:hypothetical protein
MFGRKYMSGNPLGVRPKNGSLDTSPGAGYYGGIDDGGSSGGDNYGGGRIMRPRLTSEELDARLKFVIGCVLGGVLLITTVFILYALVFVTQPIGAQAENDKMFFGVLSSVATFITGTLAGLMISTGRNSKEQSTEDYSE